jgi:hypothetical protein
MVGKAGIIISLITAIINYGTSRPLFFLLSVVAAVVTVVSGYVSSYIVARPEIKAYNQTVVQMKNSKSL